MLTAELFATEKVDVAVLITDKIKFKIKKVKRENGEHIMIKGTTQQ